MLAVPVCLFLCLHNIHPRALSVPGIRTSIPPVIQYPGTPKGVQFVSGLCGMLYGLSIPQRVRGVLALLGAIVAPGSFAKAAP